MTRKYIPLQNQDKEPAKTPAEQTHNPSPHNSDNHVKSTDETESLFSRLTLAWYTKFLMKGYKSPIQPPDIFPLPPSRRAAHLAAEFESRWSSASSSSSSHKTDTHPSVFWIVANMSLQQGFGWLGLLKLVADTASVCATVALREFVKSFVAYQKSNLNVTMGVGEGSSDSMMMNEGGDVSATSGWLPDAVFYACLILFFNIITSVCNCKLHSFSKQRL
jgi:hypothetical protein